MAAICVRKLMKVFTSALLAVVAVIAVGVIVTAALSTILLAPLVLLWVASGGMEPEPEPARSARGYLAAWR